MTLLDMMELENPSHYVLKHIEAGRMACLIGGYRHLTTNFRQDSLL